VKVSRLSGTESVVGVSVHGVVVVSVWCARPLDDGRHTCRPRVGQRSGLWVGLGLGFEISDGLGWVGSKTMGNLTQSVSLMMYTN